MEKKHVKTVAKDIRNLLEGVKTGTHSVDFESPELLGKYGVATAMALKKALSNEQKERPPATFYASEIGSKCYRQLWYKYYQPTSAEPLTASMSMKYMYGGIIEEATLKLAELAGHKVTHEQHPVEYTYNGVTVRGRIDAIIDGTIVDVKSVSSFGYKDFQYGKGANKFGYKEQLDFYQWQADRVGIVTSNEKGFLVVDKQLGHIDYFPDDSTIDYTPIWLGLRAIAENPTAPPFPRLPTVAEGSNEKLGLECSYCPFKLKCWEDVANSGKGLRAFKYSNKIVWLAKVNKEPKVEEVTDSIISGGNSDVIN